MSGDKKEKKVLSSFKFDKSFKDDLELTSDIEGISQTKLIEREMNRYFRSFKRAAIEIKRQNEIKNKINQDKEN
jgi:predicted transcriptional regulator